MNRRALIAMVHIAKKDLALDDGTYREVLERITGKSSAADLGDRELAAVVEAFRRQGWKPKSASTGKPSVNPQVRLIWRLWGELVEGGHIKAKSPRAALRAWVKKQTNVSDPEWLDGRQCNTVIESLKKWLDRVSVPR